MNRLTLGLAALLTCMFAMSAQAGVLIQPPPGPARIAKSDVVIVGKVESIEPQDVKVGEVMYRIAIVKINEGLKGIKDEKTLRIGFVPLPAKDDKGPKIIRPGARPVQLSGGQEGLFLLNKQGKENFYVIGGVIGYFINSDKNPAFETEVQAAKAAAKVAGDPHKALQAKDAEERLAAAAILIEKYRTFRGANPKQEAIDADESKQLLQALADADWKAPGGFASLRANPQQLFGRLGITVKDGFVVPKGANYQEAAQAWVRDNAEKYRIQRVVAGDTK